MLNTEEAIARFKLLKKLELETGQNMTGLKKRVIRELYPDQIDELAKAIYGEVKSE
jgi:hypothetical protein